MIVPDIPLFIALLASHVLGAFVFPSSKINQITKQPARKILTHAGAVALLSYLFAGRWTVLELLVAVFLIYAVIGLLMRKSAPRLFTLFLEQCACGTALLTLSACPMMEAVSWWSGNCQAAYMKGFLFLIGAVLTIFAGGVVTGMFMDPFLKEMHCERTVLKENRGFERGGVMIGRLERALIFILVLSNHVAGVGFLIAAKSIFRFGELKEQENRMEAEYIIIGTLLSFMWGIVTAYLTAMAIALSI